MNEEIEAMVPLSDAKLHAYLEDGGSLWSHLDVENMAGELLCARDLLGRLASDKEAMRAERDEALASATFERTVANEWLAQLHDARRERDEARNQIAEMQATAREWLEAARSAAERSEEALAETGRELESTERKLDEARRLLGEVLRCWEHAAMGLESAGAAHEMRKRVAAHLEGGG